MATKKIDRIGYGQVEPNHLSGIVTGQILAQLPTASEMGDVIENGRFAKYDYATGTVNTTGKGEWMLIYNEQKFYDEREQSLKDFAMIRKDFTPGRYDMKDSSLSSKGTGEIYPRLISTVIGDIFTTNCFKNANTTGSDAKIDGDTVEEGKFVKVGTNGYLEASEDMTAEAPVFQVVKIYTMPDGQDGVKLMRVK